MRQGKKYSRAEGGKEQLYGVFTLRIAEGGGLSPRRLFQIPKTRTAFGLSAYFFLLL